MCQESLPQTIVLGNKLFLLHLLVCGMGRPNWRRTCHPSFQHCWPFSILGPRRQMIMGVDLHYISQQLVVWQLGCVSGLFLRVRVGGRDVRPRDGNGAGRGRVSLSHTHPRIKNSSPSPYPNPMGIKLFSHPHPHRVTGIISYPYPYPCSNYFNINFYKRKKLR